MHPMLHDLLELLRQVKKAAELEVPLQLTPGAERALLLLESLGELRGAQEAGRVGEEAHLAARAVRSLLEEQRKPTAQEAEKRLKRAIAFIKQATSFHGSRLPA